MAQIVGERVSKGDAIVDYEDKVFEDIQAEPGEKAFILMHTVPFEGSVGLVNMLTATRINRKGFDTHLVLYGPGSLMASAARGYPRSVTRLSRRTRLQQAAADLHGRGRPRLRLQVLRRCPLWHARDRHDGRRQADQSARRARRGVDSSPQRRADHADLDGLKVSRRHGPPLALAAARVIRASSRRTAEHVLPLPAPS